MTFRSQQPETIVGVRSECLGRAQPDRATFQPAGATWREAGLATANSAPKYFCVCLASAGRIQCMHHWRRPMIEDRPTTKSQRLRKRMEKDAERQATRRRAMREQGRPSTHAVDRAIAEAVAYVALRNLRDGEKMEEVLLSFLDVIKIASRVLAHRDQFDKIKSTEAVALRLASQKSRRWTLGAPQRPKGDALAR